MTPGRGGTSGVGAGRQSDPARPALTVKDAQSPREGSRVHLVLAPLVHQGQGVAQRGGPAYQRLGRAQPP